MSTEAKEEVLGVYNKSIILHAVTSLIKENEEWRGTPTELLNALCLVPTPRALAVQVNKLNSELEKRGIFVKHAITGGRYLITITKSQKEEIKTK